MEFHEIAAESVEKIKYTSCLDAPIAGCVVPRPKQPRIPTGYPRMKRIITLSDLECDYLNEQQCCSKLNEWVLAKLIANAILIPLFMFFNCWYLALANVPGVAWMAYEYFIVPSGNIGVYDPTEIHKRGQLKKHMRDCLIFLAWYLVSFFIYLYCLIISILKENPLDRPAHNIPEY